MTATKQEFTEHKQKLGAQTSGYSRVKKVLSFGELVQSWRELWQRSIRVYVGLPQGGLSLIVEPQPSHAFAHKELWTYKMHRS